ncbi:MAG: acylphosphatase [Candidatus Woesearchaeota archaeon]|nr:acylphosphatase [Candidatus Woesearchaeota archaeon]
MKRVHLFIHGQVKGVFFRAYTKRKAKELGLIGFVRNVDEGVEVVAQGEDRDVNLMLEFCKRGPTSAIVEDVEVIEEQPKDDLSDFEVRF